MEEKEKKKRIRHPKTKAGEQQKEPQKEEQAKHFVLEVNDSKAFPSSFFGQ